MNIGATLQGPFGVILEASFSAAILAVIIGVAQWALRGRLSPAWRFALWTPVLLRLFVPIFPESAFSLFNAPRWVASYAGLEGEAPVVVETGFERIPQVSPESGFPAFESAADFSEPRTAANDVFSEAGVGTVIETRAENVPPVNWRSIAVWLWICGVAVLLGRLGLGVVWVGLRVGRGGRRVNERLDEMMIVAARMVGNRSRPRLRETALVESPALFGLWRPVLLLPPGFGERLSETEIRHVFLHELAHLKRRDLWVNWLMALAQAVHWFNPVVWLVFRRMRLERELACDEMALRACGGSDAKAYGETILRLLEGVSSRRALPAVVGIAEEKHSAKQRLQQIATFRAARRKYWVGMVVLAVVVLVGLTNAQGPKKTESVENKAATAEAPRLETLKAKEEKAEPVAQETESSPEKKIVPQTLEEKLATTRIDRIELEGLTLTEAIAAIQEKLPPELAEIPFRWYQTTNLAAGSEGRYSVNAIGYIESVIGEQETPADEIRIWGTHLRERTGLSMLSLKDGDARVKGLLGLVAAAADKAIVYTIHTNRVTFRFVETAQDKVIKLLMEGGILMESGKTLEAKVKFQEALKIDPNSRPARYYLSITEQALPSIFRGMPNEKVGVSRAGEDQEQRDAESAGNSSEAKTIEDELPFASDQDRPANREQAVGFDWYLGNTLMSDGSAQGAGRLIQDGRMLLEMGKLDEAKAKFEEAKLIDPANRAARYYLVIAEEREKSGAARGREQQIETWNAPFFADPLTGAPVPKPAGFDWYSGGVLIAHDKPSLADAGDPATPVEDTFERLRVGPNPNARTNRVHTSARRQAIVKKLQAIEFERYDAENVSMLDIIKDLARTARDRDAEKVGVNFVIDRQAPENAPRVPKIEEFSVTVSPPLRKVRLIDLLDVITKVAVPPDGGDAQLGLKYSIEDYGVVFSYRSSPGPEPLYTRTFRVDPNTFVQGLDAIYWTKIDGRGGVGRQGSGGIIGVTSTNSNASIQEAVRNFFAAAGVNFSEAEQRPPDGRMNSPQKAVYFNDRSGVLLVRATLRELKIIENALVTLHAQRPQVELYAQQIKLNDKAELEFLVKTFEGIQGKFRPALTEREFREFKQKVETGDRFFVRLGRVRTLAGATARASLDEHAVNMRPFHLENDSAFMIEATSVDLNQKERAVTRRGRIYDGQTFIILPKSKGASRRSISRSLPRNWLIRRATEFPIRFRVRRARNRRRRRRGLSIDRAGRRRRRGSASLTVKPPQFCFSRATRRERGSYLR